MFMLLRNLCSFHIVSPRSYPVLLLVALAGCTTVRIQEHQQNAPAAVPLPTPLPTPMQTPQPVPAPPLADDTPAAALGSSLGSSMGYGEEIALRAIALVGKPYRYGGADLKGFDCSGMVYFIHQALGIEVPRTAAEQQRAALSVDKTELRPGDLLFFRTTRAARTSHVGVYVGENRFVHAPQSGKLIELRTLSDDYYAPRLVGTGRLYPNS